MNKIILLTLVIAVAWGYYTKNGGFISHNSTSFEKINSDSDINNLQRYQCDGRQHCSQMNSYEEAKYFIENCPNTKMDGDNDGIPCEKQFGR